MLKSFFKKSQPSQSNPQQQALQHIQIKIKQAIDSWKKSIEPNQRSNVKGNPWFLVVGAADSGKTTLLAKSGLDLHSNHSTQVDCSKPTRSAEFWSGGQHLWVDVPGDWYSGDENSEDEQRFHHLLKLIPRYRHKKATTAILQVIDIHKVTYNDSPEKDREFALVSRQLQFLHDWNNTADIHFILNQADSIPGFEAFFSQLSQDERKQLMGIGLDFDDNKPIFDSLHAQLNAFYNQLSAQTIKRLHQERSQITRDLIHDFPFQIKSLLARINQLLETLPEPVLRRVRGIYLSSCHQQATNSPAPQLAENPIQLFNHKKTDQIYFVEDLFLMLLAQVHSTSPRWKPLYTHALVAIAAITFGAYAVHAGFNHSKQQLNQLNQSLQQDDLQSIANAPDWLNQLIRLQYVEQQMQDAGGFKASLVNLITFHSTSPTHHAQYIELLQNQLKPFIFNQISSTLAADIQTQSPHLIRDFIVYFKLTQPQSATESVIAWFEQNWNQQYPHHEHEVELLTASLRALLQNQPQFTADIALTQRARALIAATPTDQLIFDLLQQQRLSPTATLSLNPPDELNKPLLQQDAFFDPATLTDTLDRQIPAQVSQLMTQTWLLGRTLIQPDQQEAVTTAVKNQYLSAFSHFWKSNFEQLHLAQSQKLESDVALASYLSDLHSPLWKTLRRISDLILSQNPSDQDKKYWQEVRQALNDENNQTLITAALKETASYLRSATYADNNGKAVFFASKKRMHSNPASNPLQILLTLANIVPSPISNWLSQLSEQSWQHMLHRSVQYLNLQWKTTLYSDYENSIDRKYPFFKDSRTDTSVEEFNQFFGLDGSVQKFYEHYLADFVNLKQSNWSLKKVAGGELPLNPAVMNSIVQASLIQKMFYQNTKETPSSRFSIKPTHLAKTIKTVTLEINGQATDFSLLNFKPFTISWPSEDKNSASLQCTTVDNVNFTLHYDGPWAWLRLLEKAHISHSKKGTFFNVTFDFDQHQARFKLAADNHINPYASDMLDRFRLPEEATD